MRGSLSRFREFPLQVGPVVTGGAAFCTRSEADLDAHHIDTGFKRQVQSFGS